MKEKTILLLMSCFFATNMQAQQYSDMSLDELFAIADSTSSQIQVSITAHEASMEGLKAARSQRLPDVSLSASGSYIGTASVLSRGFSSSGTTTVPYTIGVGEVKNGTQPTPHWGNDFVLQVSQVIYSGGGISAGIRLAEQGERMALLDIEKNRQEVRFVITGHYLELCKLDNQLDVVRHNIDLTEKILRTMRSRHEQGTVLKNDITRYELQLKSLQLNETQIKNAREIINHQLVTTLHLPDGTAITPQKPETIVIGSDTKAGLADNRTENAWQDMAADGNISLQQARLAATMSEQEEKAVRSSMLPSVALVAENHLTGPYVNDLIPVNANINSWFIGLGIKYNLGSIWRKNHDLGKARLTSRQSREQIALLQENINSRVQAEYVNLQTSAAEVETQKKQVALADEHFEVTRNRYENGLALLTDMLDASNMKLSADIELVNAQINLLYNYYKLKYTTNTL